MKIFEKIIVGAALVVIGKGIANYSYDLGYQDGHSDVMHNVNTAKPHAKKKWFDLSKYTISINKKD